PRSLSRPAQSPQRQYRPRARPRRPRQEFAALQLATVRSEASQQVLQMQRRQLPDDLLLALAGPPLLMRRARQRRTPALPHLPGQAPLPSLLQQPQAHHYQPRQQPRPRLRPALARTPLATADADPCDSRANAG